jgi:outer membrane protein TolC
MIPLPLRWGPAWRLTLAVGALVPVTAARARAQQRPTTGDSLRLGALQSDALRRDPRARQLDLLAEQSTLRLRTLDAERLPTVELSAQAQYQSDVVAIPFQLPGGAAPPLPPHDSYDARLGARQPIYDPTRAARRDLERARLAESQARVHSSLFAVRQRVNEAYFTALRMQAQRAELETGITDLEAQLRVATARVRGGTALPSEAAALEVELLRRRQSMAELDANRTAALVVLADLTGRAIADGSALAIPDLASNVARARAALGELHERPEYQQFARSRELLDRQRESVAAQALPRVSAFGRAGYGRPGLNPLGREFDEYWLAGVQVEWTPWSWGSTERERQELAIQQQIVATEEAAFSESVRRGYATDLATIDRLAATLAADEQIIALREGIVRETRLRFGEGVVTSAEYVDRETDLLEAQLARAGHRVELAQAQARFLTLIGLEVR